MASQQLHQQQMATVSQFGPVSQIQPQQQIASLFPTNIQKPTSSASIPQYSNSYASPPVNITQPIVDQQLQTVPMLPQVLLK